jgi:hypothetical protein
MASISAQRAERIKRSVAQSTSISATWTWFLILVAKAAEPILVASVLYASVNSMSLFFSPNSRSWISGAYVSIHVPTRPNKRETMTERRRTSVRASLCNFPPLAVGRVPDIVTTKMQSRRFWRDLKRSERSRCQGNRQVSKVENSTLFGYHLLSDPPKSGHVHLRACLQGTE